MTLVVLDPGFFREDGLQSADAQVFAEAERRLRVRLDDANRVLRGRTLVVGTQEIPWLDTVYHREVRGMQSRLGREAKTAIDQLFREHKRSGLSLSPVVPQGAFWGVAMMADWLALGGGWRENLEYVLAATAHAAQARGEDALFLCHQILGRNAADRSSNTVELIEVLRWRVTVSVRGAKTTVLPCVAHPRHIDVPWTRRMDPRLPDATGPGLHPYCPPPRWKHSGTTVTRTLQSRPCWIDAHDQGWARPATGKGYHWDVYLTAPNSTRIGLSQINVTRHGVPSNEGQPGDLHHVPSEKQHAIRSRTGWRCPS